LETFVKKIRKAGRQKNEKLISWFPYSNFAFVSDFEFSNFGFSKS